jgi:hypothetical protein
MRCLLAALLALSFCVATSIGRASTESEFDAGNHAFDDKKFLEARQHYESLVSQGVWTPNVFYNLGSANHQIGADGLAMLNYERALALEPRHRDAYAALDLVRKSSSAKLPPRDWRQAILSMLTFDQWVILTSAAAWLAVFVLLIAVARRRPLRFGSRALFVLSVFAAASAGTACWLKSSDLNAAVIVTKQVEARLAPADRASLADTLPAGSRVQWLNERSGWVECRLPSGSHAWVPASSIERIRLSTSS